MHASYERQFSHLSTDRTAVVVCSCHNSLLSLPPVCGVDRNSKRGSPVPFLRADAPEEKGGPRVLLLVHSLVVSPDYPAVTRANTLRRYKM